MLMLSGLPVSLLSCPRAWGRGTRTGKNGGGGGEVLLAAASRCCAAAGAMYKLALSLVHRERITKASVRLPFAFLVLDFSPSPELLRSLSLLVLGRSLRCR